MGIGMLIGSTDVLCSSYSDKEIAPGLGGMEFPLDPTIAYTVLEALLPPPSPFKAGLAALLPAGSHRESCKFLVLVSSFSFFAPTS